jgi:hypothetical protein
MSGADIGSIGPVFLGFGGTLAIRTATIRCVPTPPFRLGGTNTAKGGK